jgi:hypothetical protein
MRQMAALDQIGTLTKTSLEIEQMCRRGIQKPPFLL